MATNADTHEAAYAAEGGKFRVTCPWGCELGTSQLAATEAEAERRIAMHRLATTPLGRQVPAPVKDARAKAGLGFEVIGELEGADLHRLVERLAEAEEAGRLVTLRVALDGGVKYKINEGGWSPPIGRLV
jgi:hypothetical protein